MRNFKRSLIQLGIGFIIGGVLMEYANQREAKAYQVEIKSQRDRAEAYRDTLKATRLMSVNPGWNQKLEQQQNQ